MVVERGVRVAVSDPQAAATGIPREPWVSTIMASAPIRTKVLPRRHSFET